MKTIILSLILLTNLSSFAQTYYPFPTDSAEWSDENYQWMWFPDPDECIASHYGLLGDTLIDGQIYSKLYRNTAYTDSIFNPSAAAYTAAIRQDSTKKVWVRMPADTVEILYYDFALDSGDTFDFDYFPSVGSHRVRSIDSILVDGSMRKVITFESSSNGEYWIEGIGSGSGWFNWQYIGNISTMLLCYKENQDLLYKSWRNYCHCNTFTGRDDLLAGNELINIYPNPVSKDLYIEFKSLEVQIYSINIYSVTGQKIYSLNSDENLHRVDTEMWNGGLYFLEIIDENESRWSGKIIKAAK